MSNADSIVGNYLIWQKVRTGALRVGMLMKTDKSKADRQQLINKWTTELKSKCPSCGT